MVKVKGQSYTKFLKLMAFLKFCLFMLRVFFLTFSNPYTNKMTKTFSFLFVCLLNSVFVCLLNNHFLSLKNWVLVSDP